ncbi:alpha/beta fold hydrolase [Thalassospira sp. MCCC 1A03138]|uniref:alpha/beta fold hydrolase n=1 Tax=Thalassospira sp. MCCC 1A03138 TaxID=1470576 RepID=UPI000A1F0918|nr:alpha/beta hydrolase [Thalassospira sp. MCCC 1A03138]OSQ29993.1 alpha/beta hydrolase [Thalassospira sp. MCCC 1A03138]
MTAIPHTTIPVVFLSGMLADHRMWQPVIARMDARARRGVAPAITPMIPELDTKDDVAAMARDVLDLVPDRFVLVGMSMGGYVAFEILRMARERVSHLMLVNTRATADDPVMRRRRILLARLSGVNLPFQGVNDAMLDDMLHPDHRHNHELVGLLSDMAEDLGEDVFKRQIIAVANRPDSMALLPELDIPCTVMVGEADRVISPVSHYDMAARIPGARMIEVAGAGHYVPLEQPHICADALCELIT